MSDISSYLSDIFKNYITNDEEYEEYELEDFYKNIRSSNTKLSSLSLDQAQVIYNALCAFSDFDAKTRDHFLYDLLLYADKNNSYDKLCMILCNYLDMSIQEHMFDYIKSILEYGDKDTICIDQPDIEYSIITCLKYGADINTKDNKNKDMIYYLKKIDRKLKTDFYKFTLDNLEHPKDPGYD